MATGGSSLKLKSSSLKKKRSKTRTEVRRKKRDKSSSRKKSKSKKKLPRIDDSYSDSDDDYSTSSVSYSSSDPDDGKRRRRSRSRTRKNVKSKRKRARSCSSSSDSSQDSYRNRKRKGRTRAGNSNARKKSYKKRSKRDISVSSTSSDLRSCPTCCEGSSSRDESTHERFQVQPEKKEKSEDKLKSITKRSRHSSKSSSLCGQYGTTRPPTEEIVMAEHKNSQRLRSVITFANESTEKVGRKFEENEGEEIIYDHDDYPCCRSGDSNDGCTEPGKKRKIDKFKGTESFSGGTEGIKDDQNHQEGGNDNLNAVVARDPSDRTMSKTPAMVGSPSTANLELILRQKALENLRKFRGFHTSSGAHADQNGNGGDNVKQLPNAKTEQEQTTSLPGPPVTDSDAVFKTVGTTSETEDVSIPDKRVDSLVSSQNDGKIMEHSIVLKSGNAKEGIVSPADSLAVSQDLREKSNASAAAIPKSGVDKPALKQRPSGTYTMIRQVLTSQARTAPKKHLSSTKSSINDSLHTSAENVACNSNNQGAAVSTVSTLKSTVEQCNSNEEQGESKEASQFEKKTMSVMRGGEMVQVNYKVYIPKKAPALSRRPLQR